MYYQVNLTWLAGRAGIDRATARNRLEWLHEQRWIEWIPNARPTGPRAHDLWIHVDQVYGGLTVDQWIETFRHQWHMRHPNQYDKMT